jgi:uncharacterized surface protein with fasciclin (FAS1) repeats
MLNRKQTIGLLTAIAAAVLMLPLLTLASPDRGRSQEKRPKDIVDTAAGNDQFSTLVAAIQAAGLVDALKDKGPFTVFAPTNDAFAKLPAGTVEELLKEENLEQLQAILTYHVVPGRYPAARVVNARHGELKTLQGGKLQVRIIDGNVKINDATVIATDVIATNGVIHVIDSVLLPE